MEICSPDSPVLCVPGVAEGAAVAGAVVGVLLALLLIAAIVFYFLCYRKKRKDIPKADYPGSDIRLATRPECFNPLFYQCRENTFG